jgi:multidrug efflux system outer membrane protein
MDFASLLGKEVGMKRFPTGGFWVLFLAGAGAVFAQTGPEAAAPVRLTLDRAVELALGQSISLQKTAIELRTQETQAENLWSQVFPGISVGGSLGYGSETYPDPQFRFNYGAALELTLPLRPTLPGAMKAIDRAYRAQLLNYASARKQLAVQVAQSFYLLIQARQNLDSLENVRDLAIRQAEQNQARFNNGTVSQVVFLRSRLNAEEARLNLSRAEAAYVASRGTFLVSLGLDQYQEVVLDGDIEIERIEADPERLIAEYLPKRPDIMSRRQKIEQLELERRTTALDTRLPTTVTVSAGISGSGSGGTVSGGSGSGGAWNMTMPLSGRLTVSIPLNPWIPGTTEHQRIQAAGAAVETARLDLRDAENQARLRIRTLTADLRNSWAAIEIARLRLEIAERAYELSEEGFRNGTIDSLLLADSRNSMAQARQELLSVEYSYLSTILDLSAELNMDWDELRHMR